LFDRKAGFQPQNDPEIGHETVKFMWKTRPKFEPKNSLF